MVSPASLSDAPTTSVIGASIQWIEGLLLGTVGMTIAIIAVASIGLMMLAGRVPLRRGLTVVAGCFLLFGSPAIMAGLRSAGQMVAPEPAAAAPAPPPPSFVLNTSTNDDPYAGASVPSR